VKPAGSVTWKAEARYSGLLADAGELLNGLSAGTVDPEAHFMVAYLVEAVVPYADLPGPYSLEEARAHGSQQIHNQIHSATPIVAG